TSAGVILSGPVALMFGAEWRLAYGLFAAAACILAVLTVLHVPRTSVPSVQAHAGTALFSATLKRLVAASLLMGAASTALWSFGSEIVAQRLGWQSAGAGLLWVVIGAAGIAGAGAGSTGWCAVWRSLHHPERHLSGLGRGCIVRARSYRADHRLSGHCRWPDIGRAGLRRSGELAEPDACRRALRAAGAGGRHHAICRDRDGASALTP